MKYLDQRHQSEVSGSGTLDEVSKFFIKLFQISSPYDNVLKSKKQLRGGNDSKNIDQRSLDY